MLLLLLMGMVWSVGGVITSVVVAVVWAAGAEVRQAGVNSSSKSSSAKSRSRAQGQKHGKQESAATGRTVVPRAEAVERAA